MGRHCLHHDWSRVTFQQGDCVRRTNVLYFAVTESNRTGAGARLLNYYEITVYPALAA